MDRMGRAHHLRSRVYVGKHLVVQASPIALNHLGVVGVERLRPYAACIARTMPHKRLGWAGLRLARDDANDVEKYKGIVSVIGDH